MICTLFLLISCSNDTSEVISPTDTSIQTPIIFSHNDQEFQIISYYQEILDYVNDAKKQPENLEEIYKKSVAEPFRIKAYGENDGFWIYNHWTFIPPTNISKLEESVQSLIANQIEINKLIEESLKKSADKLPGGNKTVYLFPANPDLSYSLKQMKGVTGAVMAKDDVILIQIDPSYFDATILKFTIAHEYHHAVYMEENVISGTNTLLDTVILGGKADTFAKIIYPDIKAPWSEPLSEILENVTRKILMDNLSSIDPKIKDDFHNGNPSRGIPQWANYKIGNKIMELFINLNPDVSIEVWTQTPADEILFKSNYE
ncbi:hypothetical protein IM538_13750 [Cytobacillus suaedae]|nr:hypothetical protein IM538_13750 [Cytobacillus suaedae]